MVDKEAVLKTLRHAFVSFRVTGQRLIAPLSSSQSSFVKEEELEKLRSKLDQVRSALKSADDLPIFDAFDQHWMGELRDLQRRAEDVLEEIEFASFKASQLEDFSFELTRSKDGERKRQEVYLLFSCFPSECFDLKIERMMERMMERFDEIAADWRDLQLSKEDGPRRGCSRKRFASTSLTMGELCGREKDLKGVRELLLRDDSSNRSFGSICIVGMPGVGKTALVQHLYNDKTVQNHFDDRFWICASQDFDAENITRTIIQGFGEDTRDQRELYLLQDTLLRLLTGKRVLLVLDDVWVSDENRDWVKSNWKSLEASLNGAAKGSKVIFTTQNMNVSTIVKSTHVHDLNCLPDEICWSISKRRVFEGRNISTCSSLEPIGREIVKKSKGLPFAATVIGDFLHSDADEEKWLRVLDRELCSDDQLLSEILSPLQVAYNRLPPCLKRCYAYCSLFPKGYVFEKEQLIRVWIGQEFVEAHRHLQREEVGGKYFDELVSRCFFQMDGAGVERYVMHDLFHELIQSVAHECCRIEGHKLCDYDEKARHLSLVPPCLDLEKTIEFQLQNEKDLRSLLLIRRTECKSEHESFRINVSTDLFSFVKCLRALDLSHTNIEELPRSVNHLIHLRYLVLKKTKLQRLPESICGLFKLQTLDLKDCYSLNELPWGIKYLFNLRHLELPMPKCSSVCIPPGIGKLFNLVELPIFFVTSDSQSCKIGELNNLVNLESELQILGLQNICDKEEAEKAKLVNKAKLKGLTLQWSDSPCSSEMVPLKSSYMVLEGLQPNENLQHLTIRGFCGSKLPKWVGDRRFAKLVKITLEDCQNCDELPPLGQLQVLRHLLIQNLPKLKNVGPEFCGGTEQELDHTFPALETLEFIMMDALEKWDGVKEDDLPRLHTLTIMQCNKLKTLPQLRSVRKLHVKHSPQLHELPLLPSLQHMHICSGCPWLFQSCQLHCFNKEKSCEKECLILVKRNQITFELQRPLLKAGPQFGNPEPQHQMARNLQMFPRSHSTERGKESLNPANSQFGSASHAGDMASQFLPPGPDSRPPYFGQLDETIESFQRSSPVGDSPVYGRENEKNSIIEFLLSDDFKRSNLTVVCIVGESGIGKTSLAHLIYSEERVLDSFDARMFITMTEKSDETRLVNILIESVTGSPCAMTEADLLEELLIDELSGTKVFVVLDDADNENPCFWNKIVTILNHSTRGSVLLVTTKSKDVAEVIGAMQTFNLDPLSDYYCWKIFWQHIFTGLNTNANTVLVETGKQLVSKCQHNPLCIKVLAGLLFLKNEKSWVEILKTDLWNMDGFDGDTLPTLRVGYELLPNDLKKCLHYCSLFPKDYAFAKQQIVRMWMSQGFIISMEGRQPEEVGHQYFDELLLRGFFQHSPLHDVEEDKFIMHDLIRALATDLSQKKGPPAEDALERIFENCFHFSLNPSKIQMDEMKPLINSDLQSFLALTRFSVQTRINISVLDITSLSDLFTKCINIRTLDLSCTDIVELPSSVGMLKQLRYLCVNNTKIRSIPRELCSLVNLQTLEAKDCQHLVELPESMMELTNLHHLDVSKKSGCVRMMIGIGQLTNLQSLAVFCVGCEMPYCSIRELKDLNCLSSCLQIAGLENVTNGLDAKEAALHNKVHLNTLWLHWNDNKTFTESEGSVTISEEVLNNLKPNRKIGEVIIRNYRGNLFPTWMGDPSFTKLVSVILDKCLNCSQFPALGGLPSLRHLSVQKLYHLVRLENTESQFVSKNTPKFPSLETMNLWEMYDLEELFETSDRDFPCLRTLSISRCPMLKRVPCFSSLLNLSLYCCVKLPYLPDFPSLKSLRIDGFQKIRSLELPKDLPALKELEIRHCNELLLVEGLPKIPSLEKLNVVHCPKFDSPKNWKPCHSKQISTTRCFFQKEESTTQMEHQETSEPAEKHTEVVVMDSLDDSKKRKMVLKTAEPAEKRTKALKTAEPLEKNTEVVIQLGSLDSKKKRTKALKTAVGIDGITSVTLDGNRLVIVCKGTDLIAMITLLRKKLGYAELVSVTPGDERIREEQEYKISSGSNSSAGAPLYQYGNPLYSYLNPDSSHGSEFRSIM